MDGCTLCRYSSGCDSCLKITTEEAEREEIIWCNGWHDGLNVHDPWWCRWLTEQMKPKHMISTEKSDVKIAQTTGVRTVPGGDNPHE